MANQHEFALSQHTDPDSVTPALRQRLVDCWIAVTNDGGAAGFPFPPVDERQVCPVADALINNLRPDHTRLLLATRIDALAGWVIVHRDSNPVVAHWGTVKHLQTHPAHRGHGVGSALMRELHRVARDEMGLEQLHLAVRGGMGLERFYSRLGWREVGRWPDALRFALDDTRDEALMLLSPL